MQSSKKILLMALAILATMLAFIFSFNKNDLNLKLEEDNKKEKTEEVIKKDFKIELEKSKCNSKWKTIYEYEDGKKIKSKCGEVYYIKENSDKITLKEALDKKEIDIEEITKNMEVVWGSFDGGSVLFVYDKEKNTIANSSFHLEVCNNMSGSKDQFFISAKDKEYYCR